MIGIGTQGGGITVQQSKMSAVTARELKTAILANRTANLSYEAFGGHPASTTYRNVSLPRPERRSHNNFTSPGQDPNLAHAGPRFFSRVSDRMFKRRRPREKRRRRRGYRSANLPSKTKGLNFDYLRSHVVSPTKGDRDILRPLLRFFGKLLNSIRASATARTRPMGSFDGRRAMGDHNVLVEARECSRTSTSLTC